MTLPLSPVGRTMWALRREALAAVARVARQTAGVTAEQLAATGAQPVAARSRRASGGNGIGVPAVISLSGVITPYPSLMSLLFGGGGGLESFRSEFREALRDPDVPAIVLDIDSPGGLIDLVPETAAEIRAARGTKPIIAVANTQAASAAYWIAAQADELVVTPSGDVGSVGVYMLHEDWSKANEEMGVDPTYIFAGRFKTEGNPDNPLSDDAKAAWQGEVDDLYTMFVEAIAAGREVSADTVRSSYGEGRTLLAAKAVQAGMADRVGTLDEVVGELMAPSVPSGSAAARVPAPSSDALAAQFAAAAAQQTAILQAQLDALGAAGGRSETPPAGGEPAPTPAPPAVPEPAVPVEEPSPEVPAPATPADPPEPTPAPVDPPDPVVEPDVGPDAEALAARERMAELLFS